MNKWLELLLGLMLVIVPILGVWENSWGTAALSFVMGGIVVGIILLGIMFLMLGISDFRA